jgi:hypothetical protein
MGTMRVSAANTISMRLCNLSGSTVGPWTDIYGATVVRSF